MDSTNKPNKDTVQTLEWYEHIRLNVEKYIGKIGDGSSPDDGIYTLLKGLLDCSVDEYEMGWAKQHQQLLVW